MCLWCQWKILLFLSVISPDVYETDLKGSLGKAEEERKSKKERAAHTQRTGVKSSNNHCVGYTG